MGTAVHMPRPGSTRSIFEDAPLYCGRSRGPGVHVTAWRRLATCRRCVRADAQYSENSEHRRTTRRLERERALASGDIVSHSVGFGPSGTLCGEYSEDDDIDSSAVTCPACKARIAAAHDKLLTSNSITERTMTDIESDETHKIESDNQGQDPAPASPPASPTADESAAPRMTVAERRAKLEQDKADSIERAKREAAAQFEQEERDLEIDERGEQLAVTYLARNSENVTISIENWLRVSALALRPAPAPIPVVPPDPVVKPPAPGPGQGPDAEDLHNEDVAEKRRQRKAKAKPAEDSATTANATVKPARLPPPNKPVVAAVSPAAPSSTASFDAEVLAALKALGEGKFLATKIKVSRSSTQRTDALNRLLGQGKVGFEGRAKGTKWWVVK